MGDLPSLTLARPHHRRQAGTPCLGVLRQGFTLVGSQPVPPHGFGIVLRHAPAGVVHDPEVELRQGFTLVGSQPVPAHGFGIVLWHARTTVAVRDPEGVLRVGVALLGARA